ncbi:MAG: hypothetical protein O6948_06155 [Deltaproteobacteria bacterium]|nr:hypothetical protein [Deltaproteobacteria bacterium]
MDSQVEYMRKISEEVLQYFQDNLLIFIAIAFLAGFAAARSVAVLKEGSLALYIIVGVLGAFIGQFGILYFGIDRILDQIAEFRIFFDFLAAYIGAFIVASIFNFFKPH